jgi:hypothetical protein
MNRHDLAADIVDLPHVEMLEITELSPVEHKYAGKRIEIDNAITPYPQVKEWRQSVSLVLPRILALYDYLREARKRNIVLIRGTPIDPSQSVTLRRKEFFSDEPSRLLFFDVDGAPVNWRDDPEGALRQIVAQMGEPWASTSFVWLYSAGHGLGTETIKKNQKRWIGNITNGKVRVRLAFILDRPINEAEAVALTAIAQANAGFVIDKSVARAVQPNYIRRMYWAKYPGSDPLGEVETIGVIKGECEFATVPDGLAHKARWAKAQGHGSGIADHPDALSAVLGICGDGQIREHLKAAIWHLSKSTPVPPLVTLPAHASTLVRKLNEMITTHEAAISQQMAAKGRSWGDVAGHLNGMGDWAIWVLERGIHAVMPRSKIKLEREERAKERGPSKEEIRDRVRSAIDAADDGETLLPDPPGAGKSTGMRGAGVRDVIEHPGETVVTLVPRTKFGDEQVKDLYRDHPDADVIAKVWRGRDQIDPEFIGPQKHSTKLKKMCWRSEEAKEMERVFVSAKDHLCKKGKERCAFEKLCGVKRQEKAQANLWFAAHELLPHPVPPAFGKVRRIMIDENFLDALTFGTDAKAPFELNLDELKLGPPFDFAGRDHLMDARLALYHALDPLKVPDDPHRGVPVGPEVLQDFIRQPGALTAKYDPAQMFVLEWKGKSRPDIHPSMTEDEIRRLLERAERNLLVYRFAMLWRLIETGGPGRIKIHRGPHGRVIRMVGLKEIADGWNGVPILISSGTADATLLRAIWPNLKCEVEDDWRQLPRPDGVRVIQCVDKALSKTMIAIEGEGLKLEQQIAAARRLYAVVLDRALDYGGQDVGLIVYKSTEVWIRKNCHVPPWLKLAHHGDVAGSNELEDVRALFVVGRSLPNVEAVTLTTEALFGDYIAERAYRVKREGGRIPIVEDTAGNNVILVDRWEHPDPRAERVRRQITEGELIQAIQRARIGLREPDSPLDVFLLTNIALPEIGEVEPVLWDELKTGTDELMMAVGGVWLENVSDAAKAYGGLFTADGLKTSRRRAQAGGVGSFPIGVSIGIEPTPRGCSIFSYQRTGAGAKRARGLSLLPPDEIRPWLEARLGTLAMFEAAPPKAEAAE